MRFLKIKVYLTKTKTKLRVPVKVANKTKLGDPAEKQEDKTSPRTWNRTG